MSVHVVQLLLVLKSVHGCVKAIMAICHQLLLSHKAFKRLKDELLAIAHVLEDFFLEDEIAAIDAKLGIPYGLDVIDVPIGVGRNGVGGKIRFRRNEGRSFIVMARELNEAPKRHIRNVVRGSFEKHHLACEVALNSLQALTDI